jgi:type I restriction enzyme S subunit
LRFPEFDGEWEKSRLNRFASKITKKNKGNTISNVLSNSANYGIIPQADFFDRSIANSDNTEGYYIIEKNDFVYNPRKSASAPYGPINIYNGEVCGIISPLYLCFKVKGINRRFLYYYFKSTKWHPYMYANGDSGARHDRVSIKDETFLKQPLFHPDEEEQCKIVELVESIDERIATQIKIIEKLESLIRGISNNLLYSENGIHVHLGDILSERSERTKVNNQHEVLSSTVKGIFSQREYFSKDIASENNVGYKIIRLHDVVLSPQNLWMGNINYNDKFDIGIVSPSYKIFSIADGYDKRFVAAILKTHRTLYNYMLVSEQGASIVRRNLNMEAFEQLVFKTPPIDKQRKIANAISALQSRLELEVRAKTAYEKQKQWLLTQMFI